MISFCLGAIYSNLWFEKGERNPLKSRNIISGDGVVLIYQVILLVNAQLLKLNSNNSLISIINTRDKRGSRWDSLKPHRQRKKTSLD